MRHERALKLMFHCVIRGPSFHFPHQVIKLPTVSPLLYQGFAIFPLRHQRAKGPKFSIAPSRAPKWWPLISHHVIKGPNSSLRYQGAPIVTSNFPSRYQSVPLIITSSRGLHFPHRVIIYQRDLNFQNTPWDVYWLKSAVFKII